MYVCAFALDLEKIAIEKVMIHFCKNIFPLLETLTLMTMTYKLG